MDDQSQPPPQPQGAAFLAEIRAALPTLPPSQEALAQLALADPIGAARLTITEYAQRTGTSAATVTRFYRHLGLQSYGQLKLELATAAQELSGRPEQTVSGDISPDDSLDQVVQKLGKADALTVAETTSRLDREALQRTVTAIAAADQVITFGVGTSSTIAAYLQHKLRSLGVKSIAFADRHSALIGVGQAGAGDVIVAISRSGTSTETLEILAEARRHGVTSVVITANPRSAAARDADAVLVTVNSESGFRTGMMNSRVADLCLADCISIGLAVLHHDQSVAALSRTAKALEG